MPNPVHPLRSLRLAAGLTQTELAKLSGVTAATINRIETRRTLARITTRRRISNALRVPLSSNLEVFGPWPTHGPRTRKHVFRF